MIKVSIPGDISVGQLRAWVLSIAEKKHAFEKPVKFYTHYIGEINTTDAVVDRVLEAWVRCTIAANDEDSSLFFICDTEADAIMVMMLM